MRLKIEGVTVHERITYYRELAKLNKSGLAAAVGVSPSAVTFWEQGECPPNAENLGRICDLFGLTLAEFWADPPRKRLPRKAAG